MGRMRCIQLFYLNRDGRWPAKCRVQAGEDGPPGGFLLWLPGCGAVTVRVRDEITVAIDLWAAPKHASARNAKPIPLARGPCARLLYGPVGQDDRGGDQHDKHTKDDDNDVHSGRGAHAVLVGLCQTSGLAGTDAMARKTERPQKAHW